MGLMVSPFVLLHLANVWSQTQTFGTSSGGAILIGQTEFDSYSDTSAAAFNGELAYIRGVSSAVYSNSRFEFASPIVLITPSNTIAVGYEPEQSSPSVVSGTVYQNTTNRYITIYLPCYATTSGTSGTLAFSLGASSTPSTIWTKYVNGATSSSATDVSSLRIPPGFYWSVTATGVTLGTATQLEE